MKFYARHVEEAFIIINRRRLASWKYALNRAYMGIARQPYLCLIVLDTLAN